MTAIMPEVNEAALTVLEALASGDGASSAAEFAVGEGASTAQPMITVVKGNPTDVELAALVAVISAAVAEAETQAEQADGPAETWGHPTLMHRHSTPFSPESYWVNPQLRA